MCTVAWLRVIGKCPALAQSYAGRRLHRGECQQHQAANSACIVTIDCVFLFYTGRCFTDCFRPLVCLDTHVGRASFCEVWPRDHRTEIDRKRLHGLPCVYSPTGCCYLGRYYLDTTEFVRRSSLHVCVVLLLDTTYPLRAISQR